LPAPRVLLRRLLCVAHSHGDHRPPLSFPTRRSSDLYLFFGVPTWEVAGGAGEQNRAMAGLGGALTPSVLGYASSGLQTLVQNAEIRKSTRLNSSHVKSSYAAFCSKKKRQAQTSPQPP